MRLWFAACLGVGVLVAASAAGAAHLRQGNPFHEPGQVFDRPPPDRSQSACPPPICPQRVCPSSDWTLDHFAAWFDRQLDKSRYDGAQKQDQLSPEVKTILNDRNRWLRRDHGKLTPEDSATIQRQIDDFILHDMKNMHRTC